MCNELNHRCSAINVILDDKKCATMKLTIETIKSKLQVALGLSAVEEMNNEIVTDKRMVKKIDQLPSSEEEDESDEESDEENLREMRY